MPYNEFRDSIIRHLGETYQCTISDSGDVIKLCFPGFMILVEEMYLKNTYGGLRMTKLDDDCRLSYTHQILRDRVDKEIVKHFRKTFTVGELG